MHHDTLYIVTAQIPGAGTHVMKTFQGHENPAAIVFTHKADTDCPTMGVKLFGWHNPGPLSAEGICFN